MEPSNGLIKLVLSLAELLHELMERQSMRRLEEGSVTDEEAEQLGLALLAQKRELGALRERFGWTREDLNLDLGPLGKLY
jgi:hypothetical protein